MKEYHKIDKMMARRYYAMKIYKMAYVDLYPNDHTLKVKVRAKEFLYDLRKMQEMEEV